MATSILIVGDNVDDLHIWAYALESRGIETATGPPDQAAAWREDQSCDIILIDVYSSEFDYLHLIEEFRAEVVIPILLMLPGYNETEILAAYRAGVDECICKPIGPQVLVAKLRAWLARSWTVPAHMLDSFAVESMRLEPAQRQLVIDDQPPIKLSNLEFRVLHVLMAHTGQTLDTDVLVGRIWGYVGDKESSVLLKNVVYRLRRKIERDPSNPHHILAAPGGGYVFFGS